METPFIQIHTHLHIQTNNVSMPVTQPNVYASFATSLVRITFTGYTPRTSPPVLQAIVRSEYLHILAFGSMLQLTKAPSQSSLCSLVTRIYLHFIAGGAEKLHYL